MMRLLKILFSLIISTLCVQVLARVPDQLDVISRRYKVEWNDDYDKRVEGQLVMQDRVFKNKVEFDFEYFQGVTSWRRQLVLVIPSIRGVSPLEYFIKNYLVKRGFSVLIPHAPPLDFSIDETTIRQIENFSKYSLEGTHEIIDEISKYEDFDTQTIGLVGASLGGIRSSILYGSSDRFKSIFVSVAGADFPSLYATTQNSRLEDIREGHMSYLGISSPRDYQSYLKSHLRLDPSSIVNNSRLENIALVIADDDEIVPSYNQWKLWTAVKEKGVHPRTYVIDSGHAAGVVYLIRLRYTMFKWLARHLPLQAGVMRPPGTSDDDVDEDDFLTEI